MKQTPVYWLDYSGQMTPHRGPEGIPCLKASIGIPDGNLTLRSPIDLFCLIDTGSDISSFTPRTFLSLGGKQTSERRMFGNFGNSTMPEYDVGLILEGTRIILEGRFGTFDPGENPIPYAGIIGRDILQYGRLILDTEMSDSEVMWYGGPFAML